MQKVYLLFGPQGSGKSTQAEKLSAYLGIPYFNTGELLRSLAQTNTPQGVAVAESMKNGQLVPDDILRTVFTDFISQNDLTHGFVADGFPRVSAQLDLLEKLAKEYDWDILGIFIDINDQTVSERLSHRTIIVNGVETRREDDQPEILKKRLEAYRHDTLPIIDWLTKKGKMVKIDGEPSIDEVFAEVTKAAEQHWWTINKKNL